MNDFYDRQIALLRRLISDYRAGALNLNSLIQRIEAITAALGSAKWKDDVFPLILSMEQINAVAIESKRHLTASEQIIVEDAVREIESLIKRTETEKNSAAQFK